MIVTLQSVNEFRKKLVSIGYQSNINTKRLVESLRAVHSATLFHEQINQLENLVFVCEQMKKLIESKEKEIRNKLEILHPDLALMKDKIKENAKLYVAVSELQSQSLALLKNIFDANTNKELMIKLKKNREFQKNSGKKNHILTQNFSPNMPMIVKDLENKYVQYDRSRQVTYLSDRDREKYRVLICGGVVKKLDRGYIKASDDSRKLKLIPFHTKAGIDYGRDGDFQPIVSDSQGNLFAGRSIKNKFYHSSFLSGAPAFFAGLILTNSDGEILKVTNDSGHYKTNVKQTIGFLQWLGIRGALSEKVEVKIVGKGNHSEVNAVKIKLDQINENDQMSHVTYTNWMSKSKVGIFNYRYTVLDQIDKLILQYCKRYCAQTPQDNVNMVNQILNLISLQQKTHPASKRKEAVSELEDKMKTDLHYWQSEQKKIQDEKVEYRDYQEPSSATTLGMNRGCV